MTAPEPVYVPVPFANYLPEGIVRLEGYVSPGSGGIPEDKLIQTQKAQLEAAGFESGPHPDNKYVDPNAPVVEPQTSQAKATAPKDVETTPKTTTKSS